jgi:hypothetical protein
MLGDVPPDIHYFLVSLFNFILNLQILIRLTPEAFEFSKLF